MPPQMSDSQEKSDDLIAELAKLMASNAQGAEPEAKPALKMTPLSEAPVAAPGTIRIPGMAAPIPAAPAPAPAVAPAPIPAAAAPSPAPTLRIPGMSAPTPAPSQPAPSPAPAAVQPQPAPQAARPAGGQFDFGKPPGVAPVVAPEPMANWQTREVTKPAPAPEPVEPVLTVPLRAPSLGAAVSPATPTPRIEPAASLRPAAPFNRPEPSLAPAMPVAPAISTIPNVTANNGPAGDSFDFDFGFGNESDSKNESSQPGHDPIADLIAAELDGNDAVPPAPVPAPPPVRPIAPMPTSPAAMPPPVAPRSFNDPQPVAKPSGIRPAPVAAPRANPVPAASPAARESDRFAVAPVFGLGNKPATPTAAPRRDPDPMDEIESLIGEAVRVELSPPKQPTVTQVPAPRAPAVPVVPPLNTSFAPRRAELKDREPQVQSAEQAILAAAAATGARVDRLDGEDRRPAKRMTVKPPKSRPASGGSRQFIGLAVAGVLLLAAGLGLYWVLGMGRGDPSTAPVLTADGQSAKQPAPVTATAETAEPASTGLFNQLEGKVDPAPNETLVSRDETAGSTPTEVARVVPSETDDTEGGLANRKVRTVTVRPDGTIVSGDEAVAGNEVLPVDRPAVPALPGGSAEPSELLAEAAVEPDAIAAAISGDTPVTAEVDPNAVSALVANTPRTVDPTIVAPVPMSRPNDRTALVGGGNQPQPLELAPAEAPLAPVAAAPAVTTNSGGGSGAYVQIAAQRSEAEAEASVRNVQSRYGSLFPGKAPYIERADLGQKGIFYRVRVPAGSLQEASAICSAIKSNGGDCMASGG